MGCEDEVLKIKKKLDKMVSPPNDHSQAHDLLEVLQTLPIDLQILTKTRIGMTVNSLRKASADEAVVSTSKNLIKAWKKLVPEKRVDDDKDGQDEKCKKSKDDGKDRKHEKFNHHDSLPTTDSLRLKCREMLTGALSSGELPDGIVDTPDALAEKIEMEIFKEIKNTDSYYKNRVRSRVYNIRDKKNCQLRENVLVGAISPKKLASMTAEEMASSEMKHVREKFAKENMDDARLAIAEGTKSAMLKCGKCGKRECIYNQMQTRSADEPMTTFVLCNHCGNRWKFC